MGVVGMVGLGGMKEPPVNRSWSARTAEA
jgi:hypothetical protein